MSILLRKRFWLLTVALVLLAPGVMVQPAAAQLQVFFTDFNSGVPAQFSGVTTIEPVQGYVGIGTGANVFNGDFIRNDTGENGIPASKTVLTLTGLPDHTSIDVNFLLAIIDSWDGSEPGTEPEGCEVCHPDIFTVTVDGNIVFSEAFGFNGPVFMPPDGVLLTEYEQLGFNLEWDDSAYDMGLNPTFDSIPHTADTLTIEWVASGEGWQGGDDESWAIDNVEVILGVNQPPDCSNAAPSESTLWRPNHEFVPINITGVTDPDGDPIFVHIDSIFQDEPVNEGGDGNTSPDGQGVNSGTAEVRAERSGTGDGRVYHISYTADDGNGGTCSGQVLVGVPHDQDSTPVDGGALYDSTTP